MRKRYLAVIVITLLAGAGLHFLYPLCPIPLVGLFAPVNESVWEHLKLLYWPFLVAAFVLTRWMPDRLRGWSGFLTALLLQPVVLCAAYYLLLCGFGLYSLAVDLLLYTLAMVGGFYLAARLARSGAAEGALGLLIVLTAIYGVSLMAFAMAAPNLPIFISP